MNHYEEELQRNLEAGKKTEGDVLDVKAYQIVFNALKKEPAFALSSSFADDVVNLAMEKQAKSIFSEYFWFGFGIFLLLIAFVTSIVLTEFKLNLGFLKGLNNYRGLIAFGILFIALLHWLDKRLIRPMRIN